MIAFNVIIGMSGSGSHMVDLPHKKQADGLMVRYQVTSKAQRDKADSIRSGGGHWRRFISQLQSS